MYFSVKMKGMNIIKITWLPAYVSITVSIKYTVPACESTIKSNW
jgi:hypothetical protein